MELYSAGIKVLARKEKTMATTDKITLYYSPQTRATGARILLDELGAPYDLHILNMKAGEQRQPAYMKINPMGKVPAIHHGNVLITEQSAIYIYLADLFPEAGLTPGIGDPDRGTFLRWIVFYSSCFEPAVIDRSMNREPPPPQGASYSDFETMLSTLEKALTPGPYLLGERFSTADLLWGVALHWTTMFNLVPMRPVFEDYIGRITEREHFKAVSEADAAMAAGHEEEAKALAGQAA